MSFFERRRSQVTQMIRDQQTAAVSRAEELSDRLNQEIEDLRRRDADLQQLSQTHDHIQLLQVTMLLVFRFCALLLVIQKSSTITPLETT